MTGVVDGQGRAIIRIRLRPAKSRTPREIDAWIDTGFTGDVVLPFSLIHSFKLEPEHSVKAELGDGSVATFDTYPCAVHWFGEWKELVALGSNGGLALLGTGLLKGHHLDIDYEALTVNLK